MVRIDVYNMNLKNQHSASTLRLRYEATVIMTKEQEYRANQELSKIIREENHREVVFGDLRQKLKPINIRI